MPITPNGICRYLSNIPLDNQYTDTLTFGSAGAQSSYFASHAVHSQSHCKPINVGGNVVMCDSDADTIYNCNYIMFQNSNYGSKWFYAFITNIEWVNPDCCKVTFELDSFQSWLFEFDVQECFVVREHASTDSVGSNMIAEPFQPNEYRLQSVTTADLGEPTICIAAAPESGTNGEFYGPIYEGVSFSSFTTASAANSYIESLGAQASDRICAIFMLPGQFVASGSNSPGGSIRFGINLPNRPTSLNGYSPHNNKLRTYPYCMAFVSTGDGQQLELDYDNFTNDPSIYCKFSFSGSPVLYVVAGGGYNNSGVSGDWTNCIAINSFPQCAFSYDTYSRWLSYNSATISNKIDWASINPVIDTASALASTGSLLSGATAALSSAASSIENLSSIGAQMMDMKKRPSGHSGTINCSGLFGAEMASVQYGVKTIPGYLAQCIDHYFDRFGYATNRVKVPNMTGRSTFNYVQTLDCTITGNIPFNDINNIKNAFNRGVTFWHGSVGANNISNYSVENYCLAERGETDEYGEAKKTQRVQSVQ